MSEETILEASGLTKSFPIRRARKDQPSRLVAVDRVSLRIESQRTLGVVGESGSGKSTLARLLTLLEEPDSGEIHFLGKKTDGLKGDRLKRFRTMVQIVFQDPLNSLNPRMRVIDMLREPFEIHGISPPGGVDGAVTSLLEDVGLEAGLKRRFPHELSGGQRQRVAIARAIALKPKLVVLDEAVSSLDVLIQAQILNLLLKLQSEHGFSYLFISHDLRVVRHMADEVLVMYQGRKVEFGPAQEIYAHPQDPYTQRLLRSGEL